MTDQLWPGIYRHYTGSYCRVLGVAREHETGAELVVYAYLSDDQSLWVRPLAHFLEMVIVSGRQEPRFARCERQAVEIAPERCKGCGRCVAACAGRLLSLESVNGRKTAVLADPERCDHCGRCLVECPFAVITLPEMPSKTP